MISFEGLRRAAARFVPVYWLLLAVLCVWSVTFNIRHGIFAGDFRGTIWQAGKDILHGRSPYPAPNVHTLARVGNPAVYPAASVVFFAPLGLLPMTASAILWNLASVFALAAALRFVGVRDWRVYAIVFFTFPFAVSFVLAQLDAFLALGCALVWRWRNANGIRFPLSLALVIAAKILLWPLLVWAVATGRLRRALGAAGLAVAVTLAGWAAIGFAGLSGYPHLLSSLTYAFGSKGYSLMALGTRLGLAPSSARLLPFIALTGLCTLCIWLARRGRDEDAFIAAVAGGILGTPILWLHYLVIFMVAMAVKRRTFGLAWLLPIALWLNPTEDPSGVFGFAVGFGTIVLLVVIALRPVALRRARPWALPALLRPVPEELR